MSLHTALLTGSKGIETPLPTMPPKPPTGWDSQLAESVALPGWAQPWGLDSPGGPAFPESPVPPCQLLVPSLL